MHTAVAEIDSQTLDDEHRTELLSLGNGRAFHGELYLVVSMYQLIHRA